ncbi:hypothetical protein NPIL_679131 [Nephila pilipes]|uniref:Uncharacterized protein n=1 Tax=Nephila pilipes TaxID=299642 RepID=A0A8X6NL55_NEPPI|nr:hypothetical protein NPIL_679131 [Nephila pilipes]
MHTRNRRDVETRKMQLTGAKALNMELDLYHFLLPLLKGRGKRMGLLLGEGGRQRPLLMHAAASGSKLNLDIQSGLEWPPGRRCLVHVRSIIENESAKRTLAEIDF